MKIEVLLSCMSHSVYSLINKTNIHSDALVINQCDEDSTLKLNEEWGFRIINTSDRGLSKSRNLAFKHAKGDVCLICDDDEVLYDNYVELITSAYEKFPKADVIAFVIDYSKKKYSKKVCKLGYLNSLKISSWQITFKRTSIINNSVLFDESLGPGVSKAAGEENMFLYDCIKKGLVLYYVPISIGKLEDNSPSQWFVGFTKDYFYDRGIFTRKLMTFIPALLYAFYFLVRKYPIYSKDISFYSACKFMLLGLLKSRSISK